MSKIFERRLTGWRLGVALVGLAVPFAVAGSASAQLVNPDSVRMTAADCMGMGYSISDCSGAIANGARDFVEVTTNDSLSSNGIDYTVNLKGTPDLTYTLSSGNPAVPAVPVIPVPPVPGIAY